MAALEIEQELRGFYFLWTAAVQFKTMVIGVFVPCPFTMDSGRGMNQVRGIRSACQPRPEDDRSHKRRLNIFNRRFLDPEFRRLRRGQPRHKHEQDFVPYRQAE